VRRHDLDWISLIAGIVFSGIAIVYLIAGIADASLVGRFVWPVVLVALGAGGVATAVRATKREEEAFPLPPTDEQG
jgi:hypothetical protein